VILLDTNVLSELMRAEPAQAVVEWLDAQPAERLFISAITRAEIELGIQLLPDGRRRQRLQQAAERMFDELPGRCLPFDEGAASRYASIVARRTRTGRPVRVEDAQIAAVALVNGLALATRNVTDFRGIDGLEVMDPWRGEG
jgi:predicted nucleic acid-binding protein